MLIQYPADPLKTAANGLLFLALSILYIHQSPTNQQLIPTRLLAGITAVAVAAFTASYLDDIGNPFTFRLESILEVVVDLSFILLAAYLWHRRQPVAE